ncbi:MAG: aminoacyl-tRNA hydrolase [Gammaproteobacteria bacterium]|nr:aminoacyl-tRNA hydrolase [Gammaproteobacteria bacterium]
MSSGDGITLIVGLSNPGSEYEHTRHNAGAWFVNELANAAHVTLRHEAKYRGAHGVIKINGEDCHLLIPSTYMNLSGSSVQATANYFKIPASKILIVHDEIDMPTGVVRLKFDGGAGGHNGLRDIISHLNTKQFHRLRIGVGHPGNSKDVVDYVLKAPKKIEREQIDAGITKALDVLPLLAKGQFQKAMMQLHSTEEK